MKKFDLNIEEVLEHWETSHALREIIANALDESILSDTKEPEIFKDLNDNWYIRDFGRGLKYEHFTQNENVEKTRNSNKVIGKFGVGLKDALATFDRRGIMIHAKSKHNDIYIEKSTKNGFEDITTLHAIVEEPSSPDMIGTEFKITGVEEADIDIAKSYFLTYSNKEVLEETKYGQLIKNKSNQSYIYVNGLCVANEDNLLFSYNVTSPTKKLLRSLNRERTNVGRSAYSDRIKSILLECNSSQYANKLVDDLEKIQKGYAHDELQWVDVQLHACKILNNKEKILFLTSTEMMNAESKYISYAIDEGYRIVIIPENLADKLSNKKDINGNDIVNLEHYAEEWNKNFDFNFIKLTNLTKSEKEIFQYKDKILNLFPQKSDKINEILISSVMRPDGYTGTDAAGLWDPAKKRIIIHRSQLENLELFSGTLIHELIHAYTNTDDQTIAFENELTRTIGQLSTLIILDKSQASKKGKGFFSIFSLTNKI